MAEDAERKLDRLLGPYPEPDEGGDPAWWVSTDAVRVQFRTVPPGAILLDLEFSSPYVPPEQSKSVSLAHMRHLQVLLSRWLGDCDRCGHAPGVHVRYSGVESRPCEADLCGCGEYARPDARVL